MELEIDPQPDDAERRAIAAALAFARGLSEPEPDAWRAAALGEGADDPLDP